MHQGYKSVDRTMLKHAKGFYFFQGIYEALRYLYNLKNMRNTRGGELLLAKLLLKLTLLHECFSGFLNCSNSTNSRKASDIR